MIICHDRIRIRPTKENLIDQMFPSVRENVPQNCEGIVEDPDRILQKTFKDMY